MKRILSQTLFVNSAFYKMPRFVIKRLNLQKVCDIIYNLYLYHIITRIKFKMYKYKTRYK